MSKAILVMDMPEYCAECPCCDECVEMCRAIDKKIIEVNGECQKPDWCPLKEIPYKKGPSALPPMADMPMRYTNYEKGWNDCIYEILKGVV